MSNPPQPSPTNAAAQPPASRAAEVLLILLVFFVLAGQSAPHENESHYLGRLKHYWHPTWAAGDLFLESPEAHLVFAWSLGWLTKWLSLPATAWVGRTLVWSLLAWAWQRLSWRLVPVPLAAVLSAALWVALTDRLHLAGEWVVRGVEAKCFAYVFVLVALHELVDGRWNRVWLSFGAASAFHAIVGGWSVVVCGGIWIVEQVQRHREGEALAEPGLADASGWAGASPSRQFVHMLPGLVGGGLLALAGVLPAVALTWNEPPDVVAEANRIYVFERLPHHLALLTLDGDELIVRVARHGLLILALCALVRTARRLGAPQNLGLWQITWYAWGAVFLAGIGFAVELIFWNSPLTAATLLKYYWFRLTDVAVPLAVAMQSVALITAGLAAKRPWAVWALAAALVVACGSLAQALRDQMRMPVPPSDRRMLDYNAWVDACDWIAANTPPDALFITPRLNQSFKWRTGRPEVATRKDLPQDARSMVEWRDRLHRIYYHEVDGEIVPAPSLGHVGTERVLAAAREYGADFVICDNRIPLDLPIVYPNREFANDEYVIYRVPK